MYTITIYYYCDEREREREGEKERKRERNGKKGPGIVRGQVNTSDTSGFSERRGKMRENT